MRAFLILAATMSAAACVTAFQGPSIGLSSTTPPTTSLLPRALLESKSYSRFNRHEEFVTTTTRLLATGKSSPSIGEKAREYLVIIRPFTLLQAVGALVVGCLAIRSRATIPTTLSVYTSYGAGMAANDCTDAQQVDAMHSTKKNRPIPSGRISHRQAWIFVSILSFVSLLIVADNARFLLWTASNLVIMLLYALGLQKVFLVKNLIVGYLGVSPLIGAILVDNSKILTSKDLSPLVSLASVGMAVGVAREILKDVEDVLVDKAAGKSTLPNVVGVHVSHRIA